MREIEISKLTKISQRPHELLLIVLVLAIYFLTRLVFLEANPPGWNLVMYQPLDEPTYTYAAFNMYHFGKVDYEVISGVGSDAFATQFLMLMNAATYLTLLIWGNNYYGLRLAPVLTGFLIIVLYHLVMLKSEHFSGLRTAGTTKTIRERLSRYFILTYLITDFCFLIATRIQEPTLYRLLAFAVIAYSVVVRDQSTAPIKPITVVCYGFLSTTAVLLTYPGNVFTIPACFVAILYMCKNSYTSVNLIVRPTALFFLGSVLSLLIFNFILIIVFDKSLVASVASIMGTVPEKSYTVQRMHVSGVSQMLKDYAIYIGRMLTTNFLRYNGAVLGLFLISIPFFIKRLFCRATCLDVFIASAYVSLVLQGLILKGDGFLYRQLLVQQLIVIYVIYKSIPEIYDASRRFSLISQRFLFLFIAPLFFGVLLLVISSSESYAHFYALPDDVLLVSLAGLVSVLLLVLFSRCLGYLSFIILLTLVVSAAGTYLSYQNVYKSPEFSLRDVQKSIKSTLDGKIVSGDFAHAFRLYNDLIPVLNYYRFTWGSEGKDMHRALMRKLICDGDISHGITVADKRVEYYASLGMSVYDRIEYSKDAEPLILLAAEPRPTCTNDNR